MPEYEPCPNCDAEDAEPVKFTWWGGILGPKLFTHVKCKECGTTFNGKTGKSNTTAIILYTIVALILGLAIGIALWKYM